MKKLKWQFTILFMATALFSSLVITANGEPEWKTISARDLKMKIDNREGFCLVNVLPRIMFDAEHIDGSIHIPVGKLQGSTDLPTDKDTLLVFYCMGHA